MKKGAASGFLADEGMVRIDCAKIDKVTAEGDYMRIHSAGQSWMVHSTMGSLSDCLDENFVRLHRSILVRRDFIETYDSRSVALDGAVE